MRPVGHVVLIGALRKDIAAAGGRRETCLITELVAVLVGGQRVKPVVLANVVVPSAHRLIVVIAARVSGGEEVLGQSVEVPVRRRVIAQDFRADGADPACWDLVLRKQIPDITRAGASGIAGLLAVRGERVVHFEAEIGKVLAIAKRGRRHVGDPAERNHFAPAF